MAELPKFLGRQGLHFGPWCEGFRSRLVSAHQFARNRTFSWLPDIPQALWQTTCAEVRNVARQGRQWSARDCGIMAHLVRVPYYTAQRGQRTFEPEGIPEK
jgi:hypothetical protein